MPSPRTGWTAVTLPPLLAALSIPLALSLAVEVGSRRVGLGIPAFILLSAGTLPLYIPLAYCIFGALTLLARLRGVALADVGAGAVFSATLLVSVPAWLLAHAVLSGRFESSGVVPGFVAGLVGASSFVLLRHGHLTSERESPQP